MELEPFAIDPDITLARTPPAPFYREEAWLERVGDRVLRRAWLCLGEAAGLEERGSVRPVTLLPGILDEALLLARDDDGTLRLLSNVCTHRGMLLVEEAGRCEGLRCRYHGRRFRLDGSFVSMPGFEGVREFPTAADDLPRVALAERHGMLFASLDPEVSFEEWFAPVEARLAGTGLDRFTPDPSRHRDYEFEGNWALYLDNFLEGFHIPYVHPALVPSIALDEYETELLPLANVQTAVSPPEGDPAFELPPEHPEGGRPVAAWFFFLFPSTLVNVYPWGISWNIVEPVGPTRTRVLFRSLVADRTKLARGASADLHRVELEDEAVVTATQQGIAGSLYRRGRYSPRQERCVHHFHRLLAERLA